MLNLKESIMRRNHFDARKGMFALAMTLVGAMSLGSCATDGFDENEKFDSGVSGVKLKSPELSLDNVKKVSGSDGSDRIQVSWKVVYGAGGYECKAYNADNPDSIYLVAADTVDATSYQFKTTEDTNYYVFVRTLGNAAKNNTEADSASSVVASTMVPATVIPSGSDIAEFIKANLQNSDDEQAFELERSGVYTCNDTIDFQANKMTLRGNKIAHPIVTMGEKAVIMTSAQLKVKFIDFDCTALTTKWGVIEMSANPPASSSATAQNVASGKNSNKPADVFILQDPIIISECRFKNVPNCLFAVGNCSWGIADFRLQNSIVQLNCDGTKTANGAVICAYSSGFKSPSGGSFWYGGIKSITINSSTIYNIVDNGKTRMIRFNNRDLDRLFPTASGSCTLTDNTIIRTMNNKEFANNTPNASSYEITLENNIFYDTWRLQKFLQGNCKVTWHQNKNTAWGIKNPIDATDLAKWVTEEDPGFDEAMTRQEFDFTKPNGGVYFQATGAISSTIGDPRWK